MKNIELLTGPNQDILVNNEIINTQFDDAIVNRRDQIIMVIPNVIVNEVIKIENKNCKKQNNLHR